MHRPAVLALSLAVVAPRIASASDLELEPPRLTAPAPSRPGVVVSPASAIAITAVALAAWGASRIELAEDDPTRCRWCEPGRLDLWVRGELRWDAPARAGDASNLLLLAVPLASAATVTVLGALDGEVRPVAEDLFVLAASIAIADSLTTTIKHATARLRPAAWAAGGPSAEGDLHSFFSAHTSRVFAAASAAAFASRLRGRSAWRWIAAVGFTAAAATGWLRVAADQHWATDVLAGAAVGAATGFAVATAALRPERTGAGALTVGPQGFAIAF